MTSILHCLDTDILPPEQMNNPFDYTPHPLCLLAADEVRRMIAARNEWQQEVDRGKMFGVLVVTDRHSDEEAGQNQPASLFFLAAYSGQIGGRSDWEGFVPAVFDYLQPDGYFKEHEAQIDHINRQVETLQHSPDYLHAQDALEKAQAEGSLTIARQQAALRGAKMLRDQRRKEGLLSEDEQQAMIRQSQFQKAQLRRLKQQISDEIAKKEHQTTVFAQQIDALKKERKERSDQLQHWLFTHFQMLNAEGERRNLLDIFRETALRIPPAGAGECCEPKLLQYAYEHRLKPLCMAMFWWGESPKAEVRHHGQFYPACSGKCKPILTWMLPAKTLQGPQGDVRHQPHLETVYEDDDIAVVNKPAGMLSIPGIDAPYSVYSIMRERYPDTRSPLIVHRLDMATSGLLIIAKTKEAHRNLQQQFLQHTIRKRYKAVLDGVVTDKEGTLELPLAPDLLDRPRQVVDYEHGKPSVTHYIVDKVAEGKTWITLYPLTGRTHQLRVHCAHHDGLNCPILGDPIYGKSAPDFSHSSAVASQPPSVTGYPRLFLHADRVELTHPVTGQRMSFECPAHFPEEFISHVSCP